MKITKTECPRCNSAQSFRPQVRDTEHSWQEIYIACSVCRWVDVLEPTTPLIEQAKKKVAKLKQRAEYERAKHSMMTRSTREALDRAIDHLVGLTKELNEEVDRGTTVDS